jgi:hypothetical protein
VDNLTVVHAACRWGKVLCHDPPIERTLTILTPFAIGNSTFTGRKVRSTSVELGQLVLAGMGLGRFSRQHVQRGYAARQFDGRAAGLRSGRAWTRARRLRGTGPASAGPGALLAYLLEKVKLGDD